ncbi:hypothetical protein NX02_23085 [Sphingomonas sanxanigenens DSM 19645 = NX02]|uniref:DUF2059 domain-containing protein n=2 Tax=Sphingomonas sanxanigenens TaxID=397260 RepID=W0AIV2_9SPHN|nr:hypothetical protein NX02_23085 [Sphingomonas sanxanigenens DSM 19645 = NX02]
MRGAALALALALLPAAPALAQQAATAEALDSARLAAAGRVIDTMLPPAEREAMIDGMMGPMLQATWQGIMESPGMAELSKDPGAEQVMRAYMDRITQRASTQLKEMMPGMIAAMTRAYARRFTAPQLDEINAFFRTPTGRTYARESMKIMSDPDVQAWQRESARKMMEHMPQDAEELQRALAASKKSGEQ